MRRSWRPDWIDEDWVTQEFYDALAAKYTPTMPPIESGGGYLVEYLFEVGPTVSTGMGATVLSWSEIDAWCRRTETHLEPWEARLLRRLSAEYVNENTKASEHFCPPPWWPDDEPRPLTKEQVEEERQRRLMTVL